MKKIVAYNHIKKEDACLNNYEFKTQHIKNEDSVERDSKTNPYYSQSSILWPCQNLFAKKPKINAKLYIGNEIVSKSFSNDKKLLERVKKHLDQEYLDKYRKTYTFIPSPPHPELKKSGQNNLINMALTISQLNAKAVNASPQKLNKKALCHIDSIKSKNESTNKKMKLTNGTQKDELNTIKDDLPIALRRTIRPKTKPLRYWLGEKIIYKYDKETGCYTKAFELSMDEDKSENHTNGQELIIKNKSIESITATDKGKKILIKKGELSININGKNYKGTTGCSFYLPKGQKIILDNQVNDIASISIS